MRTARNKLAISLMLVASVLGSSISLAAQAKGSTGDWSNLNSVATGSKLTVKGKDGKTVDGKLSSVSDATLSLTVKGKTVELKKEDVASVYQKKNKSATKSTLIGLGVGAGAGAGIGIAASSNDNSGFESLDHAVAAGLTVLGAAAGALTGFLIGKSGSKKVLIYQAP